MTNLELANQIIRQKNRITKMKVELERAQETLHLYTEELEVAVKKKYGHFTQEQLRAEIEAIEVKQDERMTLHEWRVYQQLLHKMQDLSFKLEPV